MPPAAAAAELPHAEFDSLKFHYSYLDAAVGAAFWRMTRSPREADNSCHSRVLHGPGCGRVKIVAAQQLLSAAVPQRTPRIRLDLFCLAQVAPSVGHETILEPQVACGILKASVVALLKENLNVLHRVL